MQKKKVFLSERQAWHVIGVVIRAQIEEMDDRTDPREILYFRLFALPATGLCGMICIMAKKKVITEKTYRSMRQKIWMALKGVHGVYLFPRTLKGWSLRADFCEEQARK